MSAPRSSSRLAYLAAVLFLPALAGVIGGELGPPGGGVALWDKGVHFTAYFVLSFLATLALEARRMAVFAVAGLIAIGGALEIVQGLIGRDMELGDEIANTLGALAGAAIAWGMRRLLTAFKGA